MHHADTFREMAQLQRKPGRVTAQKGAVRQTQSRRVPSLQCSEPNPLFSHHKVPINNPHMNASSINFNKTVTPPRAALDDKGISCSIQKITTSGP